MLVQEPEEKKFVLAEVSRQNGPTKTKSKRAIRMRWYGWMPEADSPLGLGQHETVTSKYSSCNASTSACPISSMEKGKPHLVYPGGKTRCLNDDEYAFMVVPGDSDKLLFLFEGGGACWQSPRGATVLQCTGSLAGAVNGAGIGKGLLEKSNAQNPFKSYTVVQALYCSGDNFVGNKAQSWDSDTYYQFGYQNALAAMKWAKANVDPVLTSFVASGWSSASLGLQALSDDMLDMFKYRHAAVIADSFIGVLPDGAFGR